MIFLSSWPSCMGKSSGWEESSSQRERPMPGIMRWHRQTDSPVLVPSKGKKIRRFPTWQRVNTCRMGETIAHLCSRQKNKPPPWPQSPPVNLWGWKEKRVWWFKTKKGNHIKKVQVRTWVTTSAKIKRWRNLVMGDCAERHLGTHLQPG